MQNWNCGYKYFNIKWYNLNDSRSSVFKYLDSMHYSLKCITMHIKQSMNQI